MDANPPDVGDAERPVPWGKLSAGHEVESHEPVPADRRSAIDNATPDASVLWIRFDGHAPRPIYLAGDPGEILLELENPLAF